jgi:hypothetical protein
MKISTKVAFPPVSRIPEFFLTIYIIVSIRCVIVLIKLPKGGAGCQAIRILSQLALRDFTVISAGRHWPRKGVTGNSYGGF